MIKPATEVAGFLWNISGCSASSFGGIILSCRKYKTRSALWTLKIEFSLWNVRWIVSAKSPQACFA
ncbi:MAG: hypothetical protein VX155_07170, partial [Planctomycetota bacterium]|nr:hypothetical protein [Planctomycetota bacterium]